MSAHGAPRTGAAAEPHRKGGPGARPPVDGSAHHLDRPQHGVVPMDDAGRVARGGGRLGPLHRARLADRGGARGGLRCRRPVGFGTQQLRHRHQRAARGDVDALRGVDPAGRPPVAGRQQRARRARAWPLDPVHEQPLDRRHARHGGRALSGPREPRLRQHAVLGRASPSDGHLARRQRLRRGGGARRDRWRSSPAWPPLPGGQPPWPRWCC